MTYHVLKNQSLADIAIELYGNWEGVFWLCEDNNLTGVTDWIGAGIDLNVRADKLNVRLVEQLNSAMPSLSIAESDKATGIGFMKIEHNFVVV